MEQFLIVGDRLEALPGGHDLIVRIGFADLALDVDRVDGEEAGAMEVEGRILGFRVKIVDGGGVLLRDVAIAHDLANDRAVLAFDECVVVSLAWP